MAKKILIAIESDFTREIYCQAFKNEKFEVFETKDEKEVLNLVSKKNPDIILVDVSLPKINGFKILKILKENPLTKKIPVILFRQMEQKGEREKAIELEAKDFVIGVLTSPSELVSRVRMHLGEGKTYLFPVDVNLEEVKKLAKDLGYDPRLFCKKCSKPLSLFLIRDLGRGKNYFKVSFICPIHGVQNFER
jgi:DNA-binding response OmpR family regulator